MPPGLSKQHELWMGVELVHVNGRFAGHSCAPAVKILWDEPSLAKLDKSLEVKKLFSLLSESALGKRAACALAIVMIAKSFILLVWKKKLDLIRSYRLIRGPRKRGAAHVGAIQDAAGRKTPVPLGSVATY